MNLFEQTIRYCLKRYNWHGTFLVLPPKERVLLLTSFVLYSALPLKSNSPWFVMSISPRFSMFPTSIIVFVTMFTSWAISLHLLKFWASSWSSAFLQISAISPNINEYCVVLVAILKNNKYLAKCQHHLHYLWSPQIRTKKIVIQ